MHIIARSALETINEVVVDGHVHDLGVVKIFARNPELAQFIPASSNVAISWVRLECGQVLSVHKHPEPSLILVCEGSGRTSGSTEQDVRAGDMILVPGDSWHGFEGTHDGFWALSIQFNGKALYEDTDKPNAMFAPAVSPQAVALLEANSKYLEEFENSSLLRLIDDPSMTDPDVRQRLLDCQQTWSDAFQDLLHLRVAMTTDPQHKHVALDHLVEELGHNNNLREQRESRHSPVDDATFVSTMDWFRHQMLYRSDMVRTLLMHVVLEGSGEIWHREAARAFPDIPHFQEHGEDDGHHVSMGIDLLDRATPTETRELREALDEGWKMITQLCDRIASIALADTVVPTLSEC
ncbi:cupin domain-containing protein [Rhodococcus tibetensis]|uniref:Cupin domain-containing protein n=1 Tax=Rhodococcus tibetensis TaxID=2965064 RepID=A0ABT1QEH3_9NOCA|nr:cupin domain-containing protein [Rhodococcus sp. FXJ9.536]MCQ4120656.1 cupin domain-containing protein [Rhodococcus sp. FXJ9.536]